MNGQQPAPRLANILVTGASGQVGRHLVPMLISRGYRVRALTRRQRSHASSLQIDWRTMDWEDSIDFTAHVAGCDAVIHLGAEVWNIPKMIRANVEATRALADAARKARVKSLVYTSSVAVYGSARSRTVTEDSPTLTTERDVRSEYRGNASLRTYGRTKLIGEHAVAAVAGSVDVVVMRPTVIVSHDDIRAMRNMNALRRAIEGARRTHHIYVGDVVDALVWSVDRSLTTERAPGLEIFNLSDDDTACPRYRDFFATAYQVTGDAALRTRLYAPILAYNLADMAKNRMLSRRHPLGQMYFSPRKLREAGYRLPTGMCAAYRAALTAG